MKRQAFTLVELLVVIAIMAILMGLLLSAVQKVRESANKAKCASNLHELAIAAHDYHLTNKAFPPGLTQTDESNSYSGNSLFVYLLPYIEEGVLFSRWDLTKPTNNQNGGINSNIANVIPLYICPSDPLPNNPSGYNGVPHAMTSYGGNGGTRSYYPTDARADGVFFTTGTASAPVANQKPVTIEQITDGSSNTLLFGERNHSDVNYDSFSTGVGWVDPIEEWGWWAPIGGYDGIGDVTLSTAVPINYHLTFSFATRKTANPPANSQTAMYHYEDLRLCAFGSSHPAGANFAFADGAVRYLPETTDLSVLQALSTRAGGEPVQTP